jgi:hypothetical protein
VAVSVSIDNAMLGCQNAVELHCISAAECLLGKKMSKDLHLIDLVSQAGAVRKLLAGKTDTEKLAWLAMRGRLEPVVVTPDGKQTYHFTSVANREAAFFLDAGEFVFVGDHTTFSVSDE